MLSVSPNQLHHLEVWLVVSAISRDLGEQQCGKIRQENLQGISHIPSGKDQILQSSWWKHQSHQFLSCAEIVVGFTKDHMSLTFIWVMLAICCGQMFDNRLHVSSEVYLWFWGAKKPLSTKRASQSLSISHSLKWEGHCFEDGEKIKVIEEKKSRAVLLWNGGSWVSESGHNRTSNVLQTT